MDEIENRKIRLVKQILQTNTSIHKQLAFINFYLHFSKLLMFRCALQFRFSKFNNRGFGIAVVGWKNSKFINREETVTRYSRVH